MEQDQPLFMIVYIETFFTFFYLTFFLVQKSFTVLLIAKFIHRVGDTASILPGEQINHFRDLWKKMRQGKNQNTIPFKILPLFLSNLKVRIHTYIHTYVHTLLELHSFKYTYIHTYS